MVNAMIFAAALLACVLVHACLPKGSKPTPKPGLKASELHRREMLKAERQLEREWLQQFD